MIDELFGQMNFPSGNSNVIRIHIRICMLHTVMLRTLADFTKCEPFIKENMGDQAKKTFLLFLMGFNSSLNKTYSN